MIDLKSISLEFKASAIFGVAALVLSLLTGVISGVDAGTVAIRAIIITVVFAGIGFGAIMVMKNFVPEFYALFSGDQGSMDIDEEPDVAPPPEEPVPESDAAGSASDEAPSEEFSEFSGSDFPRVDGSEGAGAADLDAGASSGKMGKHIVVKEEKFAKYEPKIMAEAVRTMMSKDED
ncbi:MAG: hypothetical protein GY754_20010 [bacterium]|nr:hypothetical protein [bacterium]